MSICDLDNRPAENDLLNQETIKTYWVINGFVVTGELQPVEDIHERIHKK